MTDKLRELFDEMVSDEPPLRTTTDSAAAAGRRLVVRRRTLWTATGVALTVALVVAVPSLATRGQSAISTAAFPSISDTPSVAPSVSSSPSASAVPSATQSPSVKPDAGVVKSRHCPASRSPLNAATADGSVLPDVDRAAAAVQAAGPGIAPGKQFILRVHNYIATSEKWKDRPQVALIFDVGDDQGFGFVGLQIYTELGPSPAQRAEFELNSQNVCIDVQRRDFGDGSVAIAIPNGPSQQIYYYSVDGYDMNIGCSAQGWSASDDPNVPPPPPPLPVRKDQPLTVAQIMALADVVAHS